MVLEAVFMDPPACVQSMALWVFVSVSSLLRTTPLSPTSSLLQVPNSATPPSPV